MGKAFTSIYEPMTIVQNIIIWFDGTIRPRNHHNNCTGVWHYDGQIYVHDCPDKNALGNQRRV